MPPGEPYKPTADLVNTDHFILSQVEFCSRRASRTTQMAGQGIERRRVLQIMGTAAAAAQFPGFSKWAFACGHVGKLTAEIKPAAYRPQFFTAPEYAMVERLTEDHHPQRRDAGRERGRRRGVCRFHGGARSRAQYGFPYRAHLAECTCANEPMESTLPNCDQSNRSRCSSLCLQRQSPAGGQEDGRRFFRRVREFTVIGFYTSEIGYHELDNPALQFYVPSHRRVRTRTIPEHLHLPHATPEGSLTTPWPSKLYDVVVIGTGAGGGMAIKTLCEAGLKVCALNAGRRLDPAERFPPSPHALGHEVPRVRRSRSARRVLRLHGQRIRRRRRGSTRSRSPRRRAPSGCGRAASRSAARRISGDARSARMGDIDFRAARCDGAGIDWPVDVRRDRAVLQPRREDDRRREHRAEPAEQSGRRVSARLQLPLPRPHPAGRRRRRSACRICPTASRSSRRLTKASRLPLLRRVHDRLRHGLVLLDAVRSCRRGRGDQAIWSCAPMRSRRTSWSMRTAMATRRGVHRSQHEAGSRSARARGGRGRVVRRVRAHPAEFEIAALAERHRELERAARAQSLRSPVRRVAPTAICRNCWASPAFPTTSATARSPGCRAGRTSKDPHEEKFVSGYSVYPEGRLPGISVVRRRTRRVRLVVQARGQATLSDAGQLLDPGAFAALADELCGPRSRR